MNKPRPRRGKDQDDEGGSEALRATAVRSEIEEKKLRVEVDLENTSDRTLHVVAEMRGLRYDAATRRLTVLLSDTGFESAPGGFWKIPRMRSVEPNGRSTLEVRVPNRITRLAPGSGGAVPEIETIDLTTAVDEVEVEVAWGRSPFYRDVRESTSGEPPLNRWQAGVSRSRGRLSKGGGRPGAS